MSSVNWEQQHYTTFTSRRVKMKRLLWLSVCAVLFRPLPYFVGKSLRRWLLRAFGARMSSSKVSFYPTVRVWAPWNLEMGSYVAIDDEVNLYSVDKIRIGTKVAISREVFICTASHDISVPSRPLKTAPVSIGDGVWIGARAMILPGVTIGEGAVVAAGAVVTKDVEPWTVVGGNPARFIKKREIKS